MDVPTRRLPSGDELPLVGFGTATLHDETLERALTAALDAGYRHVDTAEGYHNEATIGATLADADVDREELFLTSKVLPSNLGYESVLDACEASLDRLGTDYLDLYLVHWPNPAISLRETMQAMARLHEARLVRNVGVSNFSPYQLKFARRVSDVPIAVNQVECHPWWPQTDLRADCADVDVVVTAAAPLAQTSVFEDEVIRSLADEDGKTPAQIVLRWLAAHDVVSIPRSGTPEHVRANLALFDWELDADDRDRIDAIEHRQQTYTYDITDETYGIAR
jgi:diketogulonate reductase-like aldo/keto reductase